MHLMAMDGINLPVKSLLGFEHQSQLEPFSRLFFVVLFFSILDMKIFHGKAELDAAGFIRTE